VSFLYFLKRIVFVKRHVWFFRIYKLLADNFYNGREFLYGLWRLPQGVKQLELRILPMQADEPVYFPREADTTPGEKVIACVLYD